MFKPNQLSKQKRAIIVVGAITCLLVINAVSAVAMHEDTTLDLEIRVVDEVDPDNVHRITELEVNVTNRGERTIEPQFNLIHASLPTRNYWPIIDGPTRLEPQESGVYTITATVPQFGIPYGKEAVLSVNHKGTNLQSKTTLSSFTGTDPPAILNPDIKHWGINPGEDYFRPYRWGIATSDEGAEEVSVTEQNESAHISVTNEERESGPWAMAGIQQRSSFPNQLHIEATPHDVVQRPTKYPDSATGVEIGESNHRVWVVFANVSEQKTLYRSGELNYILIFVPATEGERTETTVDISQHYREVGWEMPDRETRRIDKRDYEYRPVNILAFAAAYPSHSNETVSVTYHEIQSTN